MRASLPIQGKLRLWTKGPSEPRDPRDVKSGGDYIVPGVEYTLSELEGDVGISFTVYAETVKLSQSVADIVVKVEVSPTPSLGFCWSDQFRMTATDLVWSATSFNNDLPDVVDSLVSSDVLSTEESYTAYGLTPGSFLKYHAEIADPRGNLSCFYLNNVKVSILRSGNGYRSTRPLICVSPGIVPNFPIDCSVIPLPPGPSYFHYNGSKELPGGRPYIRVAKEAEDVAAAIKEAEAMISTDGIIRTPQMRGSEIVFQAAKKLDKKRFAYSVRIRDIDGKIVSIGDYLTPTTIPPINDTTEIDIVVLKRNAKPLRVGEIWNPSGVDRIHEVKHSIRGVVDRFEMSRLLELVDDPEKLWITWGRYEFADGHSIGTLKKVFKVTNHAFKVVGGAALVALTVVQTYNLYEAAEGMHEMAQKFVTRHETGVYDGHPDIQTNDATALWETTLNFVRDASADQTAAGLLTLKMNHTFENDLLDLLK